MYTQIFFISMSLISVQIFIISFLLLILGFVLPSVDFLGVRLHCLFEMDIKTLMSGTYITIRKANFQALIATKEKPVVHTGRLNNRIKARCHRKASRGVPVVAQWLTNPTRNHEVVGLIPGLAQWIKDLALP